MEPQQPLDPSRIPNPTPPTLSRKEEKEQESLLKEMDRKNKMDGTSFWWKRALLVVSFVIIIIIIFIRIYCLVTPMSWHWLSEEQVSKIDEFFVHGTIGAIIAGYLGKYFKEANSSH